MRIKRGIVSHRKHRKLLQSVKGYRMTKHKLIKVAHEASLHAGQYAYSGRKQKKSNFRKLWIIRIGEAVKAAGISYNIFMSKLKKANMVIDRKTLNFLIQNDNEAFLKIVDKVKSS
jgi:large subunit ribosomal protein L20